MRENGTHLTWPSHNPPSQHKQNIIPDENHTTPPIFSHMFIGRLIQVPVTHSHITHIQKQ